MNDSVPWTNRASLFIKPVHTQFLLHQYDSDDNERGIFTPVELFKIPHFREFYYRVEPYVDTHRGIVTNTHFGIAVKNEGSNRFDYGIYTNQLLNDMISKDIYSPADIFKTVVMNRSWHTESLVKLSKLSHSEFENELSRLLNVTSSIFEVDDLNEIREQAGLYILVLDDYACCYIGQSNNIKKRIQQHWRKLNFSTSGIDTFKALDTTRIYAIFLSTSVRQNLIDKFEYLLIHSINPKYLLNCLGGGGSLEFIHLKPSESNLGYGTDPI